MLLKTQIALGKGLKDQSQKRTVLLGLLDGKSSVNDVLFGPAKGGGGLGRARMLLGSCMTFPTNGLFLAAAVEFRANCRSFASRSPEPRKPLSWGKGFSVIYLCFGNTEAQGLYSYLPVLLCFLAGRHAAIEAQQESCATVHIGATWLDWGVLARNPLPQDPFPLMQWKGDWASASVHCLACRGYLEALVRLWEWN